MNSARLKVSFYDKWTLAPTPNGHLEQRKAQNCQSGYELKNGNCRDINECTQPGTTINVNQNICRATTKTTYAQGQAVSTN